MRSSPRSKHPDHESYRIHRSQVWIQILVPILLGAVVFIVVPVVLWATSLQGGGNVGRWAAISTMWLLVPVMVGGLVVLAVLITIIFATVQVNGWIPRFTYQAQRFAGRAANGAKRVAETTRRPVLIFHEIGGLARNQWKRLRERV